MGWTQQETVLLEETIAAAGQERLPLRSVFESVAAKTGRQPNSVRNYYYTQIKNTRQDTPAFVPFSEEESRQLVRAILRAQAKGESVRSCTLHLAQGDTKRMLRYQNKYRALLKNKPHVISQIREELLGSGTPTHDPFAKTAAPRVGRPKKQAANIETTIQELVGALYDSLLALANRNSNQAG